MVNLPVVAPPNSSTDKKTKPLLSNLFPSIDQLGVCGCTTVFTCLGLLFAGITISGIMYGVTVHSLSSFQNTSCIVNHAQLREELRSFNDDDSCGLNRHNSSGTGKRYTWPLVASWDVAYPINQGNATAVKQGIVYDWVAACIPLIPTRRMKLHPVGTVEDCFYQQDPSTMNITMVQFSNPEIVAADWLIAELSCFGSLVLVALGLCVLKCLVDRDNLSNKEYDGYESLR